MSSKWKYKAELIASCNCDWGCPCNFNARPTYGFCTGVYGASIISGSCGDVKLDGLKFAWGGKWPGAIHEGGGTAKVWIDERASAEQRNALQSVLTGKFDGMPWIIFANTVDHWLEPAFVPFEWKFEGPKSNYKAGAEIQTSLDPMRNVVTGQEMSAKIVLPVGFVSKELELATTKSFSVFSKGLKFAAPGKYAFYSLVEHGN